MASQDGNGLACWLDSCPHWHVVTRMNLSEHLAAARAKRKKENFARSAEKCRKAQHASVRARKAKKRLRVTTNKDNAQTVESAQDCGSDGK